MTKGWALAFTILLVPGCSDVASSDIKTEAFFGILGLDGDSKGAATCSATWKVGGGTGTYIELGGTDRLTCNDGTKEVEMQENKLFGIIGYSADVNYSPGTTYAITLYRGSSSFPSSIVLPPAVDIGAPGTGQSVKKGSHLAMGWNAASATQVRFEIAPMLDNAVSPPPEVSADNGAYSTSTGFTETLFSSGQVLTGNAPAIITVTRILDGSFNAQGLGGGSITATQANTVSVMLVD
jgi:hypothetical protein